MADAFRVARNGFTDAQRRYLRAWAENPAIREFRLAANAPRVDLAAAMWRAPLPANVAVYDLPLANFTPLRNAARSNIAAAALEFAMRQPADAERRLHETISVGFLLVNDGRSVLEALIGAAIVSEARLSLDAFYQATGRAAEARLVSSASDPELRLAEQSGFPKRMPTDQMFDSIGAIIRDTTVALAVRWELLLNYRALEPCTDLRQLIFGADSTYRSALLEARSQLVRLPTDSVRFGLASRGLDRSDPMVQGAPVGHSRSWLFRVVSAVTGHPVLESCGMAFGL
jgi:hypothetical protein